MGLSDPMKGSRRTSFMNKILNGDRPTQAASFLKRNPTLKKKAFELQTLCDVSVSIVSFGPDGGLETWPDNEAQIRAAIMSYKELKPKDKRESNLFKFLETKKAKLVKKKKQLMKRKLDVAIQGLSKHVDGLSGQSLMDFVNLFEGKLKGFQEKLKSLESAAATQDDTLQATICPDAINPLLSSADCPVNSLVKFDIHQNNNQGPKDGTSASLPRKCHNYPTTLGSFETGSFNQPRNDCYKNLENCSGGNNFLYNSSTFGRAEVNYGNNAALFDQFNSNNFFVGSSSSNSSFGIIEANDGEANAQENLGMVGENDIFWWDGNMVQY
ncbi:agamous-like MADS-box protein AGL75 [Ricinus communis]|uniref:agamous-like MADS-box protein AGL75 n=1 Tax=Ricinus communis TaxID=3988 RepID=UPI00201AD6B7|nr:agamous-like MADS-box protein AGL75 [Ricinus communis]